MSILSYHELCQIADAGVITPIKHDQINSASIDITLGATILVEQCPSDPWDKNVSLKERKPLNMRSVVLAPGEDYWLNPGEFILAQSAETFNLPADISAEYKLKSSMARIGLEHLNAGWCDAGWNGSVLTLEIKNMTQFHRIGIRAGVGIGQVVFYRHAPVPADRSYAARGRYNNDTTVSGIKE